MLHAAKREGKPLGGMQLGQFPIRGLLGIWLNGLEYLILRCIIEIDPTVVQAIEVR
jgi:hypothetical protein